MSEEKGLVRVDQVERRILLIRGQRVIIDADLADLFGVTTKALNQAVRRNSDRFPPDFAFRLSVKEKSEVVTNCDHLSRIRYSATRSEEHTSELQSLRHLVCRLLLEKKKNN